MRTFILVFTILLCSCTPELYEYRIVPGNRSLSSILTHADGGNDFISAHRGGRFYKGYPENSIQAFAYTQMHLPAIIECDVRMTRDRVLVLLHDEDLDRTSNGAGPLNQKTWSEIQELFLEDDFGELTSYRIPSLQQALIWGRDRVIYTLDVKRGIPFSAVIEEVERLGAENYAAIITYNWKDAQTVHRLNSELMISIGFRSMKDYQEDWRASGIPAQNILAFTGYASKDPYVPPKALIDSLHQEGIAVIYGRFGGEGGPKLKSSYADLHKHGIDIWAIDHPLLSTKVLPSDLTHPCIQKKPIN